MNASEIFKLIQEWQTLIASVIALAAAIWTIRTMEKQRQESAQQHQNQMNRRGLSARAKMPDALSGISAYLRDLSAWTTANSLRVKVDDESIPAAPTTHINALKEVIEHIENTAAQRTFELVSWYQVVQARMSRPSIRRTADVDALYAIVLLRAYCDSLFAYARNECSTAPTGKPSIDDMLAAIRPVTSGIPHRRIESVLLELEDVIRNRHDRKSS
jgi:hypothetical protein